MPCICRVSPRVQPAIGQQTSYPNDDSSLSASAAMAAKIAAARVLARRLAEERQAASVALESIKVGVHT